MTMRIACIGGGPAGLYFALLAKKADPGREVVVFERNRPGETFGFGVVFSDQTLDHLRDADAPTHQAISESFFHWDDIETHVGGRVLRSSGHGFSGMSRKKLLGILEARCAELGVRIEHEREVRVADVADWDVVVAADGVNSATREDLAAHFEPRLDWRPNRFVWLGTTFPFEAFTFYFDENEHGLWRVHAYRYEAETSTFIVECREETWKASGMDQANEDETVAYCERLFAPRLAGHRLLANRSVWRSFPTVKNRRWCHQNVVLLGDSAHTAHFSIGSGTKLAMEDSIALARALDRGESVASALQAYDVERRAAVASLQRAAQVSLEWFENTERYLRLEPIQVEFSLLTRSLRVNHANLKLRDPKLVATLDAWIADRSAEQTGRPVPRTTPPMFTPFKLRDLVLDNRVVVSPMCMYSAEDGRVDDWHLVHLGSRAVGGAGLVITEMTDVSADGRISPGCAGMYRDDHIGAWKRVVDFVHRHTRAKIGMQLAHAGRKGSTKRLWEGDSEPLESGNWPLLSASALPYFADRSQTPKAMDRLDMDAVKADFVASTERAVAAGFDLLEIHFAHGYLLGSFVSPLTNLRTDEYGGSRENRARYPLEVLDAVRAVWPAERPLSVRISATDWAKGGTSPDDAVALSRLLAAHGADIVDVSAGQTVAEQRPVYGRLFQTPFSELIRLEAGVPTMTVGNISSYGDVNGIIAGGRADLCVLARAHLYDPYFARHAATEQAYDLEWPDPYKSLRGYTPRFE